jgi:protein-disulfide isomerase
MSLEARRFVVLAAAGVYIALVGCGGGAQPREPSQPSQTQTATISSGSHVLGNSDAKVTIIKFCDFQCPYCKSFYGDTEWQVVNEYVATGKAKIAFRHFPLSIHQNAQVAAEAAECAAKVGGNDAFWKYHDTLFTKGQSDGTGLDASSLKQYAAELKLDASKFDSCLDNHDSSAIVLKDSGDGSSAGVHATPTFFVNGKSIVGALPYSTFKAVIDGEL